ncbi:putative FmdB family transcriptional regulator [Proteus phage P2-71]|nr:putative FmdB family transcriptional regulator [Proteus phage P2-71]
MSQQNGVLEMLLASFATLNENIEKLNGNIEALVANGVASGKTETKADDKAESKSETKSESKSETKTEEKKADKKSTSKKSEKQSDKASDKPKYTKSDITEALRKVRADIDKDEAVRIINEVGGVEKMGQIPEDKYEAVFQACEASLNGESDDASDDDDDL